MKILNKIIVSVMLCLAGAVPAHAEAFLDTDYAVAYSRSCLSGGCHEKNAALLNGYKQSYMTHVMVKCNACHGTHTRAEVGKPKPNLTGYVAGMGATGYKVGRDRCLVCHSEVAQGNVAHPSNINNCGRCHASHVFDVPGHGG